MLLHTRESSVGLWTGVEHAGDRAHQPPRLAADRLPGAAEQGDRRAQRVRARGGDPPGRRAQGAHDLRDHGRHHDRAGDQLDRAGQALRPPRPAQGAGGAGLRGGGRRSEHRVQALQGDRRPQEEGHRARPGGDRLRRDAPVDQRAYVLESFDIEAGSDRSPFARVRVRLPDGGVGEGSFTGDGPVDAFFSAINAATGHEARLKEYHVSAVTAGRDALAEVTRAARARRRAGARARASRRTRWRPRAGPTCARSPTRSARADGARARAGGGGRVDPMRRALGAGRTAIRRRGGRLHLSRRRATIRFGAGRVAEAPALLADHGFADYALLTTERAAARSRPAGRRGARRCCTSRRARCPRRRRRSVTRSRADLVALGGGRVVDAAKAIAGADGLRCAAMPDHAGGLAVHAVPPHAGRGRGVAADPPRARGRGPGA